MSFQLLLEGVQWQTVVAQVLGWWQSPVIQWRPRESEALLSVSEWYLHPWYQDETSQCRSRPSTGMQSSCTYAGTGGTSKQWHCCCWHMRITCHRNTASPQIPLAAERPSTLSSSMSKAGPMAWKSLSSGTHRDPCLYHPHGFGLLMATFVSLLSGMDPKFSDVLNREGVVNADVILKNNSLNCTGSKWRLWRTGVTFAASSSWH